MTKTKNSAAAALRRAHAALLVDLRELEQALRPESREQPAALRARLGATHQHITEHFRFEEQDGYMATVRKREPRLQRTIEQLAEEHRQLAEALNTLIALARDAGKLDDTFRDEGRRWIERVRQHEHRENDLVQNAFNLDIGAED